MKKKTLSFIKWLLLSNLFLIGMTFYGSSKQHSRGGYVTDFDTILTGLVQGIIFINVVAVIGFLIRIKFLK